MSESRLRSVVEARRVNAAVAWGLVALLVLSAIGGVLTGDLVWVAFIAAIVALVVLPAVRFRDPRAMLPWEVLALATLPVLTRLLVTGVEILGVTLTGRISTYFAVAAVALIVAVELDVFTPVRMTHTFAVFFVVIATMAAAGVWAVVKWTSDHLLRTAFYPPPGAPVEVTTAAHEALMWDFVAATVIGVLAGVLFDWYFRQRTDVTVRLPAEVEREIESEPFGDDPEAPR